MKRIYIVTAVNGFFAQDKMPWSSMNINTIVEFFNRNNFDVKVITFDVLKDSIGSIRNSIILYTSSQRTEHKRYIEDVISLFDNDNLLIPSIESLKAHDNKGYQFLLSKKYDLDLIDCDYLCDISELRLEKLNFPLVFKPANGASATGVKIVHSTDDITKALHDNDDFSIRDLKRILKKNIFKSRYNKEWEDYIAFGKQRFIVQKLLPKLTYDYKILIFGDKYYALKRFTAKGDFRASGSGIHSRVFDNEIVLVLNKAKEFKEKYHSHIYSLDLCVFNDRVHVIEFQFTHVGPVTLSESNCYYSFNKIKNVWDCIQTVSNLENEFSLSVLGFINENPSFCS
ncbi:TPA: hypothetical protein ACX6PN_003595 [Photobacterium damselae]